VFKSHYSRRRFFCSAMAPISQLELDALCNEASDVENSQAPSSPQDSVMKKRRRRISVTAMGLEIAALESQEDTSDVPGLSQAELDNLGIVAEEPGNRSSSPISSALCRRKRAQRTITAAPGISQEELDTLGVQAEQAGNRSSSPISSGLYGRKRTRLSVGDGPDGAAARAAELFDAPKTKNNVSEGGCCSPRKGRRSREIFLQTDENLSPVRRVKDAWAGPPQSPSLQSPSSAVPLSPSMRV